MSIAGATHGYEALVEGRQRRSGTAVLIAGTGGRRFFCTKVIVYASHLSATDLITTAANVLLHP